LRTLEARLQAAILEHPRRLHVAGAAYLSKIRAANGERGSTGSNLPFRMTQNLSDRSTQNLSDRHDVRALCFNRGHRRRLRFGRR
jgi:hypothetical protein